MSTLRSLAFAEIGQSPETPDAPGMSRKPPGPRIMSDIREPGTGPSGHVQQRAFRDARDCTGRPAFAMSKIGVE